MGSVTARLPSAVASVPADWTVLGCMKFGCMKVEWRMHKDLMLVLGLVIESGCRFGQLGTGLGPERVPTVMAAVTATLVWILTPTVIRHQFLYEDH